MPTATQLLSYFNLFAGVLLVASFIFFFGGFAMYLVRLGTWPTYREEAVGYMKWGVAILFSLVVLLAVQKFLLAHLNVFFIILALIVAGIVVWAFIPGENNTPEKKPGAH